jgi:hypothetical protein
MTHGLLGQTIRNKVYENKAKEEERYPSVFFLWIVYRLSFIEGTMEDYNVEGSDLFGKSFLYNQFAF